MVAAHSIRPLLRWLPFQFGKGKLAHYLLQPTEIPSMDVRTKSGVVIRTAQDKIYRDIYLYGEYEHNLTSLIRNIIKPGSVCLDIGANFGYYSVLLAKLAGAGAAVHSFEPLPFIYRLAQETVKQNAVEERVILNNCGLGTTEGEFIVYSFSQLTHGHASSKDLGRQDAIAHRCKVTTLDEYADERGLRTVDFIKSDVEGDELSAFRGGERLLRRSNATVAFEVNIPCLTARNLEPEAVEDFLRTCGYTEFIQVLPHRTARRVPHLAQQLGCDYIASKTR